MKDELLVDKHLARRSFERAAATYDAAAVLQDEVCRRMLARLDYIKLQPAAILDAGSGTGNALAALGKRYPQARIIALDIALAMLRRARRRVPWWKSLLARRPDAVCGDIERLPLANAAVGMVWSNLTLQWVNEPQRALAELQRVLASGGLLMFSTFGPDTLKELRRAYRDVDRYTHVNRFIDMHDLGDMLVASGFADPVMDMEYLTLTYDDMRQLMRELKAIGAHNMTRGRPVGLSGKRLLANVSRNYEMFRRDGKLPATFEVVYGHAWKPQPRLGPTGRPVIDIKPEKRF
ncbi:MAG: malonyl-[acyl-carrier protein] O-methyltransferase BioC [Betaproteobacteria bacterium RIFCSPLOWO2_12_FULL_62_13]|nr:MAG: malonyl-[acyl-carrier protein] O-methyltransferase BioC [Betaproteobacteria bacterium RIFCSPLOWO2_12_FULL_62_13]